MGTASGRGAAAVLSAVALTTGAVTGCRPRHPNEASPGLQDAAATTASAATDAAASAATDAAAAAPTEAVAAVGADAAAAGDEATPLDALPSEPLFTNLDVPGHPPAVVAIPNGATTRRPVVVVLHGIGDRPDWNCDAWRHITDAHGFVLCLRGRPDPAESTPGDARFTLEGGAALREHLDAAIAALTARFGPHVDATRPLVTGFSLGATLAAQLALHDPARFPRVALLEGGHAVWTIANGRTFAKGGGRRVLFGCGSPWCAPAAKAAVGRLETAGVPARAVYAPVGHTNDRPLQEALMRERAWFFDRDTRWPFGG